jgi:hypothetical protein
MDHCLSLIMLSGSVPPRLLPYHQTPPTPPPTSTGSTHILKVTPAPPRPPIYGTKKTLDRLAKAYHGELWPELGMWAEERLGEDTDSKKSSSKGYSKGKGKRKRGEGEEATGGAGVLFSPYVFSWSMTDQYSLVPSRFHRPLHPTLPISTLQFHVAHGCTTKGLYESSAIFIRYDPSSLAKSKDHLSRNLNSSHSARKRDRAQERGEDEEDIADGREFLFFGDVESGWRGKGEEEYEKEHGRIVEGYNQAIWEEAARSWDEGRLAGVFVSIPIISKEV